MESIKASYGFIENVIFRFSKISGIDKLIEEYKKIVEQISDFKYSLFLVFEDSEIMDNSIDTSEAFILPFYDFSKYSKLIHCKSGFEYIAGQIEGFDYIFSIGSQEEKMGLGVLKPAIETNLGPEEIKSISLVTELFNVNFRNLISLQNSIKHEHKYKQIVEESTDVIYVCDFDGNFKYINPFGSKLTGFKKEEIIGKSFLSFIRADYHDIVQKFYRDQVINKLSTTYLEFPVIKKDGKELWLGQNVQILEVNGIVSELQAVARDITQQREAENLLIESEARFQTLSKNGHAAIFLSDLDGNLIYVNEKWYDFTGISEKEVIGVGYYNCLHPEDKDHVINEWNTVLREKSNRELEFRLVNVSGEIVWVYGKVSPLKGHNDQITGYIGTLIDIGGHKNAIRFAEETNQKMQAVFNHSYDAIFLVDPVTNQIVECNERSVELFEALSKDQIIGKKIKEFRKDPLSDSEYLEINKKVNNKGIFSDEVCYLTFKRKEFWGSLAIKLLNIGEKEYSLVRISDITARKTIEKELIKAKVDAEAAMKAREQFLSVVSHEIRTPLNAIMGMTEWLIQDKPRIAQLEFLQGIKYSSENLLKLINEILDFSKIESGKIVLEEIEFSLNTVVNNIYKTFKLKAEEKKLDFSIVQDSDIPAIVLGDPGKLTQILINLVGNAIKFTEKGFVKLVISTDTKKNKKWFKFDIQDSGIGIPADKVSTIFESFTQASNDTTRKYGGSGLGLTISKKLVEIQKGAISVATTPGQGSVFTFEIPYKSAVNINLTQQKEPDYNLFENINVLLVEDNQMNQLLTTTFLQKWNVQVQIAENGKEAIDKIQKEDFDIIFMDLHMPTMDGFEAANFIRTEMNLQNLPIIALTASVLLDVREKVIGSGMNDYITKPFKPYELNAKLSMHLPHKIASKKSASKK